MVKNLILAICATVIISCDKQEDNMITPEAITIAEVQEPQTLGILEQLSKDVKAKDSGRSTDFYITSCIDDRTDIVIAGPVTNPASFVNGADRLDLDLFTFEGARYIAIRSEEDIAYGLPNDYQRMWYINEGTSLGVYTAAGKQASIDGDWDFLFSVESLHYLYEIDEDYNVVAKRPLATVSINCAGYEGWYAAPASTIDWSQGVSGEWNAYQNKDSIFIRLNSAGEYIAGGYLSEDAFYLENRWSGSSIGLQNLNYVHTQTPLAEGEYETFAGSYTDQDGIVQYQYYLDSEVQYEVRGYQLRANGSTVNFNWHPNGISNVNHIGIVELTKTNKAPSQAAYDVAREEWGSLNFFERHGNNLIKVEEHEYNYTYPSTASNTILSEILRADTDSFSNYNLEDVILNCYAELSSTIGFSVNVYSSGIVNYTLSPNETLQFSRRNGNGSTINSPLLTVSYTRNDDQTTEDVNEHIHIRQVYEAISASDFTICN